MSVGSGLGGLGSRSGFVGVSGEVLVDGMAGNRQGGEQDR